MKNNIYPYEYKITKQQRLRLLNQEDAFTLWFTGLSGSGKTTLANAVERELHKCMFKTYLLDGDNIRSGLNKDLDFSNKGRKENIRRVSEVCKLFNDAGIQVLTAFISPFKKDRDLAKEIIGENNFIEVYCDADLSVCEKRDIKGLYKKARNGEIKNFTGIDSPYEKPENPNIIVDTTQPIEKCIGQILLGLDVISLKYNGVIR